MNNQFNENSVSQTDICTICLEGKDMITTKCNHQFCQKCIKKWCVHHNNCPICRQDGIMAVCINCNYVNLTR